jgi:signal transduction histidine kinase/CheY-like chemotaxis protein/HPt (histidine-containing phosphotransfer) domain-containing protein
MNFLKNISILAKLLYMQMLTAVIVVFLISASFVYFYLEEIKVTKVENLKSLAKVVATNISSALVFDDSGTAVKIINDLKSKNEIVAVEVKDANNLSFAFFSKNKNYSNVNYQSNDKVFSYSFSNDYLYLNYPIFLDDEYIGCLKLKSNSKEIETYFQRRLQLAFWLSLIAILIAFVLALILQRNISNPIYRLLNTIKSIKENNDYSLRTNVSNKDEIGKLSYEINEMLQKIEDKDKILNENNENLQKIVKERTSKLEENNVKLLQVNEELVKAKIQAEQSKAVKELFLANMSHEIRTPLNAIIGFQDLLKNTKLNEDQLEYVSAIDFAGKNLLSLINDILDLSKIESGKLLFENTAFDLKLTLYSVIDLLKQRALDKNLKIIINHDDKIPEILFGDSTRFSQILINLVGNSLKFTEKGTITINSYLSYENENEVKCTFEVIDTGIGIDENNVNKIFERFSQASADTTRLYGGTGLGLTICKFLVEGFGGRISVKSKLGKGTTFIFDITLGKGTSIEKEHFLTANEIDSKEDRPLNILLAEDVLLNQKLMLKTVENWGYNIDIADNGEIALQKLKQNNYDIVLMDIQMPIMNGFVTTIAIRTLPDVEKRNIPIIALTAHASNAEAEKCLNLGMNAYITKPFDQRKLKQTMLNLVFKSDKNIGVKSINLIPNSNLFDFDLLSENANGDLAYIKDMFETYLENFPEYMLELERHIKAKENNLIYETIHKMKSPILLFGLKGTKQIISVIETQYKNKIFDDNWTLSVNQIKAIIADSLIELKDIYQKMDFK